MIGLLLVLAGVNVVSGPVAPTDPPGKPSECAKWVRDELETRKTDFVAKVAKEKAGAVWDSVAVWEPALVLQCVAQFSPETVDRRELLPLADLYLRTKQWDQARASVDRAIEESTNADRADVLVAALGVYLDGSRQGGEWRKVRPPIDRVRAAEKLVASLEQLGAEFTKQKIDGYERLSRAYYEEGVDQVQANLEKAIALVKTLPRETIASDSMLLRITPSLFAELGKVQMYKFQPEAAIATMEDGITLLASTPDGGKRLKEYQTLFAMVGKPAPPITATHWTNRGPNPTAAIDFKGKVTLVEFTSNWCGWCRLSYSSIIKLDGQYKAAGLQTVLHTQLYGSFQGEQNLSAQAEVDADFKYFTQEHGMTFAIGVDTTAMVRNDRDSSELERAQAKSFTDYQVGGIPHLVVIDRRGIVRQIYVGWLGENERSFFDTNYERVDAFLAKLLAEKTG